MRSHRTRTVLVCLLVSALGLACSPRPRVDAFGAPDAHGSSAVEQVWSGR